MGKLSNILKRAAGMETKKRTFRPISKTIKLLLIIPCCFLLLIAIMSSEISMVGSEISDFFSGGSSLGGTTYTYHGYTPPSGAPEPDIEEIAVNGGSIDIPDDVKERAMLENYSIEDFVKGTYTPFGVEGDGDERFKDITIKTERKMVVGKHPSSSDISSYRTSKRSEMWAEKEAAYAAAVSAAATPEPTATQTVSGTPSPTGTGTPTSSPTPPPAPTPQQTSASVSSIGRMPPMVEQEKEEERKGETFARPADPNFGITDESGGVGRTPTRPANTPGAGNPSVSPSAATSTTPSVTGTVTVSPGTSGNPTGTVTPSPTASPIPTPTWTEDDEKALDNAVSTWISENTYEDTVTEYVETVISGEQLRKYMNSFHSPWQLNYCMAAYLETYELNPDSADNVSIGSKAIEMSFEYGNMISYGLVVNYWSGEWEDIEISLENRESVLGNCRLDTDANHRDDPIEIDENTYLLEEEGFVPIVLFRNISGWAVNTYYGDRLETLNSYGYYEQAVLRTDMSRSMDGFFGYTDMDEPEIMIFANGLEAMPEPEKYETGLQQILALFEPGSYIGQHIDLSAFTHLAAGSQGEQSVFMALEIVNRGATYSQGNRYGSNSYDCSSLVNRVYKDLGINLSWGGDTSTNGLAHYFVDHRLVVCNGYDESQMQPGDVILWSKPSRTDHYLCVYHAGIYAGDGMIVDASSSRGHVVYREMWGQEQVVLVGRPSAGMGEAAGLDALGYVDE
ncbi:MAG: C40 family peptidase [Lachnospiraceae bacterium]|nr:C40 family peptidase [Lachnospiraceae bacterium]